MSKVINFPKKKIEEDFNKTLSELMKEAQKMDIQMEKERGIYLSDFEQLEKMIRVNIFDILVQSNCQNSDYFHCGTYISSVIRKSVNKNLESFYVTDYLAKVKSHQDFHTWQKAADMCFLLCSVFVGRCSRGMMSHKNYLLIGKNLYSTYYSISSKKIGYLMSSNYSTMVNVTQQALKTLSD